MLRNDGKYKFYIIKHKYNKEGEWKHSGECRQWLDRLGKDDFHTRIKNIETYDKVFDPFTACGDCWQQTGCHGSYNKMDAIKILDVVTQLNPEHDFAVFVVNVEQSTDFITQISCESK